MPLSASVPILLSLVLGLGNARAAEESSRFEKGMALGLFSQDPEFRYDELLDEVKATGATHVAITWVWWQHDLRAVEIRPVPGWSATAAQVEASV